jgi:carboxypeptidase C (cathepsin A)
VYFERDVYSTSPHELTFTCIAYRYIPAYLNKTETRKELGAENDIDIFETMCSDEVMTDFLDSMDRYKPTRHYVSNLLDRGIRVLMYAGGTDFFANHIGTEKWALDLDWSGQQEFKKRGSRDWHIHGKKAGKTRSYNGLTFASIVGAGHMVRVSTL